MTRPSLDEVLARASADALGPPGGRYRGLVLGTAHGAASHFALAAGVPWRPLDQDWPAALEHAVQPGGTVVLVHGPGQVGRDTLAAFFAACHRHRLSAREVLFNGPGTLSAAVADLYRRRLHAAGRDGDRLVVECGRLHDPRNVLRAGLVPYWCREPTWEAVRELCWWLAGSEPFASIDVLPEPPGAHRPSTAPLESWHAVTAFATARGEVDGRCARRYPTGRVAPRHAARVLRRHPHDLPYLTPLPLEDALQRLVRADLPAGLLVR